MDKRQLRRAIGAEKKALTPAEIAQLLERKLPTVKKQIARGKQKLLDWADQSMK